MKMTTTQSEQGFAPWPVIVGGLISVALTVFAVVQVSGPTQPLAWMLVVAATAMGVRPARVPGSHVAVTPIHFFILIGLIEFGPWVALAAGAGGVTGAALMPSHPMRSIQYVVNQFAIAAATMAAALVIGPEWPAIALAAALFAIVNSTIVAAAITLSRKRSIGVVWWRAIRTDLWSRPLGFLLTAGILVWLDAFSLIVLSTVVSTAWAGWRILRRRRDLSTVDALD